MNNYQLYRTNVYLGGQMKWDLVIDDSVHGLYVSDFNLTPISDNARLSFNDFNNKYNINVAHEQNITKYYNANKGIFYNECLSNEFNSTNAHRPIVTHNGNNKPTIYCNTYDMGCRRAKYNTYKKQFEFFCPLWLENVNNSITFKISIMNIQTDKIISSKTLNLNLTSYNTNTYHDRFVKYLGEYLENIYTKTNDTLNTSDNVLEILFGTGNNSHSMKIYGVDVSNGNNLIIEGKELETADASVISELIACELPVLNFDNMLMQTFKNNTMICKQLHNFNLCFNVEDILPEYLVNNMIGKNVNVIVDVYVDDVLLDKMDFCTEYDYIRRQTAPGITEDINVYNYLKDYAYINNIGINKFGQNICHWSLCDNNDYIFNMYNGFAGIIKDYTKPDAWYFNEKQYGITADIHSNNHRIMSSIGWINTISIDKWSEFYSYIKNTNKQKHKCTSFGNKDIAYINNLKYRIPMALYNKYVICLHTTKKLFAQIQNTYSPTNKCIAIDDNSLYAMHIDDVLILISYDLDNFTFLKLHSVLYNFIDANAGVQSDNELFNKIYNVCDGLSTMMMLVYKPKCIYSKGVLNFVKANGPHNNAEVDYEIIPGGGDSYVYRYDGKIKPTFISNTNTLYYKDHVLYSNLSTSKYGGYTKYETKYPSIDYCGINKISNWTRNEIPMVSTTNATNIPLIEGFEHSWYGKNKCILLKPKIVFEHEFANPNEFNTTINDIILSKVGDIYSYTSTNGEYIAYIKNLYSYTYEYIIDSATNKYKYSITLTLK